MYKSHTHNLMAFNSNGKQYSTKSGMKSRSRQNMSERRRGLDYQL